MNRNRFLVHGLTGQKVDEIQKEVASELDAIKAYVNATMDIPHNRPIVSTNDRNFFQRLFRFYAPHLADGWVYRGLYFLSLDGILFIFLMGALTDPTSPPTTAGTGSVMPFWLYHSCCWLYSFTRWRFVLIGEEKNCCFPSKANESVNSLIDSRVTKLYSVYARQE